MLPILRTKMLCYFYRGLAPLLSSGITIIDAMDILSGQGAHQRIKYICYQLKRYLSEGVPLGEAFAKFPDFFPQWQANIMKYSETSGRLAEGLSRLADYVEKDYSTQQSIIVGLAYPVLLLHAAIFLLPILKGVTCGFSGYISELLKMIIPVYGLVFFVIAATHIFHAPQLKTGWDTFVIRIPVIGNIVQRLVVSRFIRALQCLSSSGVSITSAWKMAAEACGNNMVKYAVLKGLPFIEQGQEISKAFIQAQVFTPHMIGMIAASQKSGSIVQALNTIATYSEKETETAIAVLTSIMPILVYLPIAAFIAFRIISFYSSYFNTILNI